MKALHHSTGFVFFITVWLLSLTALSTVTAVPKCPTTGLTSYCSCVISDEGLNIDCDMNASPSLDMQYARRIFRAIQNGESGASGPINSARLRDIEGADNFILDDILAGNAVRNVTLDCLHNNNVDYGPLTLSSQAFTASNLSLPACTLTRNLMIRGCNLRELDASFLRNCNLETLAIVDSYVSKITKLPKMDALVNLTISSSKRWLNVWSELPVGLSEFDINAQLYPNLEYLDLSGNSLVDSNIQSIQSLTKLESVFLKSNNFSTVPDLTNLFNLVEFTMDLDSKTDFKPEQVSIWLPNPRRTNPYLDFTVSSSLSYITLENLKGDLKNVDITLNMTLLYLEENVFKAPLQSMVAGTVHLKGDPSFFCGCDLAWLIADELLLLRVRNGVCLNRTPFEELTVSDLGNCFKNRRH